MSKPNDFKFFQKNKPEYKNVGVKNMLEYVTQQRREFKESQQRLRGGESIYNDAQLIVLMGIYQY